MGCGSRGWHRRRQVKSVLSGEQFAAFNTGPVSTVGIRRAVLVQHQTPPANRPVTDAQGATDDDLFVDARRHHEVDCGVHGTTRSGVERTVYVTGVDCGTASLLMTQWDNSVDLEDGWSCIGEGVLLCQPHPVDDVPPTFFSTVHVRGILQ